MCYKIKTFHSFRIGVETLGMRFMLISEWLTVVSKTAIDLRNVYASVQEVPQIKNHVIFS